MLQVKVLQLRFIILLTLLSCSLQCQDKGVEQKELDWWQTAQFYQIYPRSFMDSNGDGIGDLKGITSKLTYLKDIGVTAVWLSPIYTSPMVDFGYDISDFYGIQPEYGTIEDFRDMIAKANELGLKIILDFVPNHSSTENEWFKKSVKRERGYEDYYVWHDGKLDASGKRIPPSNWLSGFRGSAWEWNEERQQYYLHQFAVQQADLNYRNPFVVEQMKRVLRYWLDQGVAGFRVDALTLLFEVDTDENGQYPDEEVSGLTDDKDDKNYLKMDLIENRPESIDMVYQWHQVMETYKKEYGGDTRVLLIETYAPPDYSMQMYGNATTEGAELPFNFNLITEIAKSGMSAKSIETGVSNWLSNMPEGRTANWVIGNHDQRRAATRYGKRNIDAMNMLVMMLPGASITYQGEELGMLDGVISWEDTVDPAACNANPDIYEQSTRDPARTPFQWSSDKFGGFTTGSKTWLPMAPDYETLNVATESSATNSHLKIYKSLVELRKSSKTLQQGSYKYQALNDNVFVLKRYLAGEETLLYVANFGEQSTSANIGANFDNSLPAFMTIKIGTLDSSKNVNASLAISIISLAGGEAVILAAN
ncbi:maltase A1-like isoform X3 [Lucilia sericata]|uniref:maltase A1-like isoform X3 n=1 Tax=Lucilia sericata TaxID=13632 RepID=UPI0018A86E5D|nr:maltase A1-like isoform X3 [Lucilia sericata]